MQYAKDGKMEGSIKVSMQHHGYSRGLYMGCGSGLVNLGCYNSLWGVVVNLECYRIYDLV